MWHLIELSAQISIAQPLRLHIQTTFCSFVHFIQLRMLQTQRDMTVIKRLNYSTLNAFSAFNAFQCSTYKKRYIRRMIFVGMATE